MSARLLAFFIVISGFLAALAVDGFIVHWAALGTTGQACQELLKAFAVSVLTAAVMWAFVEHKSIEEIKALLDSPGSLFGRVGKNDFIRYISEFLSRHYLVEQDLSAGTIPVLLRSVYVGGEYWEGVDTHFVIPAETDANGYTRLFMSREFTLRGTQRTQLRFCCRFSGNRDKQIHDEDFDLSWILLPSFNAECLPPKAFRVTEVRINDARVPVQKISNDDDPEYIEFIANSALPNINGAKIYFSVEVLQSVNYAFISSHIKRPSKDVSTSLNYAAATEIKDVWPSSAFLNDGSVRELRNVPRNITVKADGWVLPKGAVFFSWSGLSG